MVTHINLNWVGESRLHLPKIELKNVLVIVDQMDQGQNVKLWCNTRYWSDVWTSEGSIMQSIRPWVSPTIATTFKSEIITIANLDEYRRFSCCWNGTSPPSQFLNHKLLGPTPCICLNRVSNLLSCFLSGSFQILLFYRKRDEAPFSIIIANFLRMCDQVQMLMARDIGQVGKDDISIISCSHHRSGDDCNRILPLITWNVY